MPPRREGREVPIGLQKRRACRGMEGGQIQARALPKPGDENLTHRIGLVVVEIEGVEQLKQQLGQLRDSLSVPRLRHGDAWSVLKELVNAALARTPFPPELILREVILPPHRPAMLGTMAR
jgi:hypothetical protein